MMNYTFQEVIIIFVLIFYDSFVLAVINKLIKEIVPNIRVSTDARDLILNCCSGKSMDVSPL